jgi:hypothetical protein
MHALIYSHINVPHAQIHYFGGRGVQVQMRAGNRLVGRDRQTVRLLVRSWAGGTPCWTTAAGAQHASEALMFAGSASGKLVS